MEFFDQRSGPCLANLTSQVGRLAADLAFDAIQCADALDSFRGNR